MQKDAGLEIGGKGVDAKEVDSSFLLQVEEEHKAKDFIWEHLPQRTKDWFLYVTTMPAADRHKHYVTNLFLQATKEGDLITQEIVVLTEREIPETPNRATSTQILYHGQDKK